MLEQTIWEQLENVIFKILADMFFLFPEEEEVDISPTLFEAKVSINSEEEIILRFFISQKLAELMAENFLGESPSSKAEIQEVLKEFVNMVGGNFIAYIDTSGKRKLHLPEVKEAEASILNDIPDLKKYNVEGEFLGFVIKGE